MLANVLSGSYRLPKVANNSLGCLREILYVLDWTHSYIFSISYIDVSFF